MTGQQSIQGSGRAVVLGAFVLVSLASQGCMILPWPHKVDFPCHITGKVVDDSTGEPVPGIQVYVASLPSHKTETKKDGSFELGPTTEWRYFVSFTPLPIGPLIIWAEPDWAVFHDRNNEDFGPSSHGHSGGRHFRDQSIMVYSMVRTHWGFTDSYPPEPGIIVSDLGIVKLKRFSAPDVPLPKNSSANKQ